MFSVKSSTFPKTIMIPMRSSDSLCWLRMLMLITILLAINSMLVFCISSPTEMFKDALTSDRLDNTPINKFINGIWFSDFHFDPLYDSQYGPQHMCRSQYFFPGGSLVLEPHPLVNCMGPSMCRYGRYGCDMPYDLLMSVMDHAKSINPQPRFVLITGDLVAHLLPSSVVSDALGTVTNAIQAFFPTAEKLFVIGNNDASTSSTLLCGPNPWLDEAWDQWSPFIPPSQKANFLYGGYYSKSIEPGLTFIVLNTIYWSSQDVSKLTVLDIDDPCGMLQWMRIELDMCRRRGDSAIIACHIGPGVGRAEQFHTQLLQDRYQTSFVNILREYSDIIKSVLTAHTHREQFRIVDMNPTIDGNIVSPVIAAPAVSPIRWNNPSYRQLSFDPIQGILADMVSYYTSFSSSGSVQWHINYRFSKLFNSDLSPKNLQAVALRLLADNILFDKWWIVHAGRYPQTDIEGGPGNGCSTVTWTACSMRCAIRYIDYNSFVDCCHDTSSNNLHIVAKYLIAVGMSSADVTAFQKNSSHGIVSRRNNR